MRITLDLPARLVRELKARAALEGVKLQDYCATIVQTTIERRLANRATAPRSAVPVFRRTQARLMPALSNAELYAVLDEQDAPHAKPLQAQRQQARTLPRIRTSFARHVAPPDGWQGGAA